MSAYAPGYAEVAPPMVSPFSLGWTAYATERVVSSAPSSAAWEGADVAVYMPILVPCTCVVRRLWWANGSSVSASYNIDCGVFASTDYAPGTRLISTGNTAQGTASEVQFVDVTDTVLAPGLYWVGLGVSSTSATIMRSAIAGTASDAAIRFEEAAARPLPATATPTESSSTNLYVCGFATTASP